MVLRMMIAFQLRYRLLRGRSCARPGPPRYRSAQDVGGTIDDGVEQLHQHRLARRAGRTHAGELMADVMNGSAPIVAHGDQPVPDRMKVTAVVFGTSVSGLAHQGRGHVTRAVLHVEAAGDLDLLHPLRVGTAMPDLALDQLVFLLGRTDEIEPNGVFRDVAIRRHRNAFEARYRAEHRPTA